VILFKLIGGGGNIKETNFYPWNPEEREKTVRTCLGDGRGYWKKSNDKLSGSNYKKIGGGTQKANRHSSRSGVWKEKGWGTKDFGETFSELVFNTEGVGGRMISGGKERRTARRNKAGGIRQSFSWVSLKSPEMSPLKIQGGGADKPLGT